MLFSIITPSYGQLDWLRLCVASVADQVLTEKAEKLKSENAKIGDQRSEVGGQRTDEVAGLPYESTKVRKYEGSNFPTFPLSHFSTNRFAIEHIIQDGGTSGIEAFAREIGEELKALYGGDYVPDLHPFELLHFCTASGYTLRIFKEPDVGMYDALNKGFTRAKGEICAWLNCDEQYLERTLRKVADIFSRETALDVLLGDALLTDGKHRPLCYRRIMVPGRWHTRLDHLHSLSCAMFFRKSALPSPPFDPRWKVIGDAVLMDYFLGSKKKIRAYGSLLAAYSFTGTNLSANPLHRERAVWWAEVKWPPACMRPLIVLHNRLRRMACGAYRKFTVREGLFTDKSFGKRLIVYGKLSGRWPKNTTFSE